MTHHGMPGSDEPRGEGAGRQLMVVDPAEESRTRLAAHFRALGYEVRMAADGVQALADALTRSTDVVIMRVALPRLDGYEVAAILSRVHPRVQIILTADDAGAEPPQETAWSGCFRCFPEPLDVEAVSRVLREAQP